MKLWSWLQERFTAQGQTVARYKSGMRRARRHDHSGAIADYDEVIGMVHATAELKSMARYNRALVHAAAGDAKLATSELTAVIAQAETPINVRTAARQKLVRLSCPPREKRV